MRGTFATLTVFLGTFATPTDAMGTFTTGIHDARGAIGTLTVARGAIGTLTVARGAFRTSTGGARGAFAACKPVGTGRMSALDTPNGRVEPSASAERGVIHNTLAEIPEELAVTGKIDFPLGHVLHSF